MQVVMVQFLSINFFFLDFFNFCWVFQKFPFFCVILYKFLDTDFHGQLRISINSAVSSPVRPLLLLLNDKSTALNPTITSYYVSAVGRFFLNLTKKTFNVKGLHTIEIL